MASKDAHFVMRGREAVQSAGKDYRLVANFVVRGREAVRASKCEQVWQLATKHGWCSPNCSDCDASSEFRIAKGMKRLSIHLSPPQIASAAVVDEVDSWFLA